MIQTLLIKHKNFNEEEIFQTEQIELAWHYKYGFIRDDVIVSIDVIVADLCVCLSLGC